MDDATFRDLLETRAREPERIGEVWGRRPRRDFLGADGRLFIIAADHPARGIFKAGSNARAMENRRELLDRIVTALALPGVDGVLGTADVLDDLALLGALDNRLAIGSMNRGGIVGSAWELDDRFTGIGVAPIVSRGLDAGKMLLRIDLGDRDTIRTIEACADAISGLGALDTVALIEPLPVEKPANGPPAVKKDADSLAQAAAIAAGLGDSSAHTWLKLPVVDDMERVAAATTLPALLLGGDPGRDAAKVFAGWQRSLALPQVRGLVAGRALLYPEHGDVGDAVSAAAEMVHGAPR